MADPELSILHPKKRKVDSSILSLTTSFYQCERLVGSPFDSNSISQATSPSLPSALHFLLQRHVRIDGHRDLGVRVTGDFPDHARWRAKIKAARTAPQIRRQRQPLP